MVRAALSAVKHGGVAGLRDFIRDRRQAEIDRSVLRRNRPQQLNVAGSSLSDAGLYPLFCQMAADDAQVFSRFRRSLIFRDILEHVTKEQGLGYLAEIEQAGSLLGQLQPLLESDALGDPYRYAYGSYGFISPSTLRYIKVAADLGKFFGPLSGMTIAEIGVGYGGQCRVVKSAWPVGDYKLFDIPEVLALSRQFLDVAGVDLHSVHGCDGRNPESGHFDLLISNYAFSELRRELQEDYWERVIRNSIRGYVTFNHITPVEWNSLSAKEFAARIPGAQILPEKPLTHPANVVVAWGMSG